jgi:hypothetical protein
MIFVPLQKDMSIWLSFSFRQVTEMKDYRINTRFSLKDESQRKAAEYLKTLGRKRNRFIVEAVLAQISINTTDNNLLESIRRDIFARWFYQGCRRSRLLPSAGFLQAKILS